MTWHIPVKTEHMKTESTHLPSMLYAQDIYKVASRLKKFKALEIGAAWGFSTLAILEAGAKSLLSVDNNVKALGQSEAEANGYSDRYSWSCVRSETFWNENKSTFDLIYVDGSHKYEDVVNDLYCAWEVLNTGGLLMADDWDHKKNIVAEGNVSEYGVSLACFEFWRDHIPSRVGIDGRVLWFKK